MSELALIETTEHEIETGRPYLQFTPVLKPDCCAAGTISFAVWQVWQDEPNTHDKARSDALANARKVICEWAAI